MNDFDIDKYVTMHRMGMKNTLTQHPYISSDEYARIIRIAAIHDFIVVKDTARFIRLMNGAD